jgi:hypothetical protein
MQETNCKGVYHTYIAGRYDFKDCTGMRGWVYAEYLVERADIPERMPKGAATHAIFHSSLPTRQSAEYLHLLPLWARRREDVL